MQTKTLWLGGIPFHYEDQDLRNAFSKFGTVTDVKVGYMNGRPLGYCFVTFAEREHTEAAFHAVKDGYIGDQPPQEGFNWRVDYDIGKEKKRELGVPPSGGGMKGRGGFRGGPPRGNFNNGGRRYMPNFRGGGNGGPGGRGGFRGNNGPMMGHHYNNGPRSPPQHYHRGPPMMNNSPPPQHGPPPGYNYPGHHDHHPPQQMPPQHYHHPNDYHHNNSGRERAPYYSGVSNRYNPYSRGGSPPRGNYSRGGFNNNRGGRPGYGGGRSPPYNGPMQDHGGNDRRDMGRQSPPPGEW